MSVLSLRNYDSALFIVAQNFPHERVDFKICCCSIVNSCPYEQVPLMGPKDNMTNDILHLLYNTCSSNIACYIALLYRIARMLYSQGVIWQIWVLYSSDPRFQMCDSSTGLIEDSCTVPMLLPLLKCS